MNKKNERCPNRLKRLVRCLVFIGGSFVAIGLTGMFALMVKAAIESCIANPKSFLIAGVIMSSFCAFVFCVYKTAMWAFNGDT